MTAKPGSELERLKNAARFSAQGLVATFKHEAAFRLECVLLILSIPLAFWLGENITECVVLIASVVVLMIVELLNSAIESAVDRIGDEHHTLAGRAKDQGSAAVMLTALLVAATWLTVIFN